MRRLFVISPGNASTEGSLVFRLLGFGLRKLQDVCHAFEARGTGCVRAEFRASKACERHGHAFKARDWF
jgi:hypothetical protein